MTETRIQSGHATTELGKRGKLMSKDKTITEFKKLLLKVRLLISKKSYEKASVLYPKLLVVYDKVSKSDISKKKQLSMYKIVNKIYAELNKHKKVNKISKKIVKKKVVRSEEHTSELQSH